MNAPFEDQAISLWLLLYTYKSGPTTIYSATNPQKIVNYIVGTIATLSPEHLNDDITNDVIQKLSQELPLNQHLFIESPDVSMNVLRVQLTQDNLITQLITKFYESLTNASHTIDKERVLNDIIGLFNNRDS